MPHTCLPVYVRMHMTDKRAALDAECSGGYVPSGDICGSTQEAGVGNGNAGGAEGVRAAT